MPTNNNKYKFYYGIYAILFTVLFFSLSFFCIFFNMPTIYSSIEYCDMLKVYYECGCNRTMATRSYLEKFPFLNKGNNLHELHTLVLNKYYGRQVQLNI